MQEAEEKLAKLTKEKGIKNAEKFMELLGRDHAFVQSMSEGVGKDLLGMLGDMADAKMTEIINMKGKSCADCPLLLAKIEMEQIMSLVTSVGARVGSYKERLKKYKNL